MINNKESKLLYKKFNPKIIKYLKKYYKTLDREKIYELRNDIFIKLFINYNTIPEDNNEISKYIYITCKNHMLNYKKNKDKISFIEYTDDESVIDESTTENNNIENEYFFYDQYNYELSKLDRLKRDILNYKNMGYNLNEIAKITNIPKTNIYRVFEKIKNNYDNIQEN
jgi:DNA-directed RNA polymerase specialized sigma24 family protein